MDGSAADVHASRFVEFAGAYNFRDLGGLPANGGGRIRRGVLFRSDALHALDRSDVGRLRELGVVTVVDLRSEYEVAATGRGLLADESIGWFHAPLSNVGAPDYQPSAALASGDLGRHYLDTLDERSRMLARAFMHLATADHLPAVFHCTVGKDRTGVLAALVLGCVGVPARVIVEDYALTDDRMAPLLARLRGDAAAPADIRALGPSPMRAEARSMEQFLAGLDAKYGGPGGWARAAGIDGEVVENLRVVLVDHD
jgi:protein tyrosine/serine phosphatase